MEKSQTQMPFPGGGKGAPEWPPISRTPANGSGDVISHGYDPATRTLEVEFMKAAVYRYHDVDAEVYRGLIEAKSAGTYLNAYVKGKHGYKRVDNATGKEIDPTTSPASAASREYFKNLCIREGYCGTARLERYNASLEAVARVMNARPNSVPTVDEWIDGLTQAQISAGIEWLKGHRA